MPCLSGRFVLPCFWHIDYVISFSTKKIVAISTVSRSDHGCAQTRELACTKIVIPQAIARGKLNVFLLTQWLRTTLGLNVVEVAHDIQQQVSKFVTDLKLINSYDTWHGNAMCYNYACTS